jgi:putative oxidoreductase
MLAWIFVGTVYGTIGNFAGSLGYFTSLKVPAPLLFTWLALMTELLLSAGLILGIGTRYCAILAFVFVLVATALGHRYWEYPAAQQTGQYINFLKNISIMGGALAIFVTGGGRFSLDRMLANSSLLKGSNVHGVSSRGRAGHRQSNSKGEEEVRP